MGVDCTLMVLHSFDNAGSYEIGSVAAVFRLRRDYDLWEALGRLDPTRTYGKVQLPHGGHAVFSSGVIPEGFEHDNPGVLAGTPYGDALQAYRGSLLAGLTHQAEGLNRDVIEFISKHYADRLVVLYWS